MDARTVSTTLDHYRLPSSSSLGRLVPARSGRSKPYIESYCDKYRRDRNSYPRLRAEREDERRQDGAKMGVASLRLSVACGDLGANFLGRFHIPPT
jgi:hypothetical protein